MRHYKENSAERLLASVIKWLLQLKAIAKRTANNNFLHGRRTRQDKEKVDYIPATNTLTEM